VIGIVTGTAIGIGIGIGIATAIDNSLGLSEPVNGCVGPTSSCRWSREASTGNIGNRGMK
jgi:hypothetical protein